MRRITKFTLRYFISLFLVIYSYTLGIFTRKGRDMINNICLYFNLAHLKNKIVMNLPLTSFSELIDNNTITLIEPVLKSGNVDIGELAIINGIIIKNKPNAIFEIGTFDGRTALNMAMSSTENCVIYTLNLPPGEELSTEYGLADYDKSLADLRIESGARFVNLDTSEFPHIKKIKQLYGDSAKFDFSPYFGKISLVFIDAAHNYDYVLNDSEIALKLLRNGKGIILWHDYREPMYDVIRAIDTIRNRHKYLDIYHIADSNIAYLEIK